MVAIFSSAALSMIKDSLAPALVLRQESDDDDDMMETWQWTSKIQ
jgi:hypothetical protein